MFPGMMSYPQNFKGENGRNYKLVAGVLRSTNNVWEIYQDAVHKPVNIASLSADSEAITINFSFTAKSIGALVCCPDETYVAKGINFGASVGTQNAVITPYINRTIGGYINYNGSAWVISNAPGVTSAVWSTDKLVITHNEMYQAGPDVYRASVVCRDGAYIAQLGSLGFKTIDVTFYDYAGTKITTPDTNMKLYFTRTADGAIDFNTIDIPGSNIWVFGVFEV